jgi:histidine kinase
MASTGPAGTSESGALTIDAQKENFQRTLSDALLVSAFAALEAALIVSLSASTRIVEPLHAISAVSRRLAQGFYQERTVIKSHDELAEMGRSVNQLAEALEQTEQRRMALMTDVTHEIRTPLATIAGYMEGLLDGVIKPDEQTFHLVLHETRRLQRLSEDLQLLSRAEAGQIPIVPRVVNLRTILRNIATRLGPQFATAEIDLSVAIPESLPPVYADPDRVDQIVINLLTNARRYTPAGGKVTLRAHAEEYTICVDIEDTGIGIAPEHLPHVFERFYRVDKSRSRASGGSGIGLTIARHLIYAQGGEIWVNSDGPGRGSTFSFTLPRTTVDPAVATPPDSEAIHTPTGSELTVPRLQR